MRSMRVPGLVPDWLSSPEKKTSQFHPFFSYIFFLFVRFKKKNKKKQTRRNEPKSNERFFFL